ncbi:MAG TPA: non-heme iron oxygenase ferredoxin subunit [Candidatus Saccharimonadales bacterium]|nr:non-heme iron oxygenase ferredoxin subunit [Candidatus Saccharimonadales bacterium]
MWHRVADVTDLAPGEMATVYAGNVELALCNVDGEFYATGGLCPHQGGSLGDGWLEGHRITCPLHGWVFDARTGEAAEPLQPGRVNTYPVKIEDGGVWADVPEDLQ